MLRIAIIAVSLCLLAQPAQAGFFVPLLFGAAFAATAVGTILSGVLTIGFSIGLSYVASKLLAKQPDFEPASTKPAYAGGLQLNVRFDADVPQSLLWGRAVTAGSAVYANTYGVRGEVANSDLIEIRALADHPCAGLFAVYVQGKASILRDSGTDRGWIVDGYTGPVDSVTQKNVQDTTGFPLFGGAVNSAVVNFVSGNGQLDSMADLLAIKFFDGSQSAADQFTVDAFGNHPRLPWTVNHIGTGTTYVRMHSIYDQNKVPGQLEWKFVVDGIRLYDPRKDSSVSGGSGSHRFNDLSTHEWTDNLAVFCYNLLRGIYVADANGQRQFFYGLEGTAADQLPLDVWFAAMNECDVVMDLGNGLTEKQYTGGGEISVDTEPLEVIKSLMQSCGGRFVENGGIYKIYIGAPGLPVLSFRDDAIIVNQEERFKPVLGLNSRVNYITGNYTSPADGWVSKVAPPREITEWRAEDGRRLPASLNVPMVQSDTQMQRLMLQYLNRSRRQRQHVVSLPPSCFVLEPGDVVEWTSSPNGYDGKLFEAEGVDCLPNLNVTLSITEVDPADYDWSTDDELPVPDGHLVTVRPAPKVVEGFEAVGFVWYGDLGTKRPAIRILWTLPQDGDVVAVRWQLRVQDDPSNITSGTTDNVDAGQEIITAGLQSLTTYEVRGRFESFNGYETEWTLWTPVTTPDARIVDLDFDEALRRLILQYIREAQNDQIVITQQLAALVAELDSNTQLDKATLTRNLARAVGNVTASYNEAIDVAVGPDSAIARTVAEVDAKVADIQANIKAQFVVGVTPEGALAQYDLVTTAEDSQAGLSIVAFSDGHGGAVSRVQVDSDRFYVGKTGTTGFVPIFIVDTTSNPPRVVLNADLVGARSIKASMMDVESLTAISANLGNATVSGSIRSPNGVMTQDFNNGRILISR